MFSNAWVLNLLSEYEGKTKVETDAAKTIVTNRKK